MSNELGKPYSLPSFIFQRRPPSSPVATPSTPSCPPSPVAPPSCRSPPSAPSSTGTGTVLISKLNPSASVFHYADVSSNYSLPNNSNLQEWPYLLQKGSDGLEKARNGIPDISQYRDHISRISKQREIDLRHQPYLAGNVSDGPESAKNGIYDEFSPYIPPSSILSTPKKKFEFPSQYQRQLANIAKGAIPANPVVLRNRPYLPESDSLMNFRHNYDLLEIVFRPKPNSNSNRVTTKTTIHQISHISLNFSPISLKVPEMRPPLHRRRRRLR